MVSLPSFNRRKNKPSSTVKVINSNSVPGPSRSLSKPEVEPSRTDRQRSEERRHHRRDGANQSKDDQFFKNLAELAVSESPAPQPSNVQDLRSSPPRIRISNHIASGTDLGLTKQATSNYAQVLEDTRRATATNIPRRAVNRATTPASRNQNTYDDQTFYEDDECSPNTSKIFDGNPHSNDEISPSTTPEPPRLIRTENQKLRVELRMQEEQLSKLQQALNEYQTQKDATQVELNLTRENFTNVSALLKTQTAQAASDRERMKEDHAQKLLELEQRHTAARAALCEKVSNERKTQIAEIYGRDQPVPVPPSHLHGLGLLDEEIRLLFKTGRQHMSSIKSLMEQHNGAKAATVNREKEHQNGIKALHEGYSQQISQIKNDKNTEIQALTENHRFELGEVYKEHNSTVQQAENIRQTLIDEYENDIFALKEKFSARLSQKQTEIGQIKQEYEARLSAGASQKQSEIKKITEDYEAQLSARALYYKQYTQQMRKDIEKLNQVIHSRDDELHRGQIFTSSGFPSTPDDRIAAQFSSIVQIVDSISRLPWEQTPQIWTNENLEMLRGRLNDREIKKAIVQDLIWSLLEFYVFAIPFRVFDEEGKSLEVQWSQACDEDRDQNVNDGSYHWPPPSMHTEIWRYMTISECRKALRPPVPSDFDPRSRLRKGFMQSLEQFEDAACSALNKLMALSDEDVDTIRKLVKKAATIWLELTAHRCRIIFKLKYSSHLSLDDKLALAKDSSLDLNVLPELGRYGNAMGTDLDDYEIIENCKAQSLFIGGDI